jgi:hypothetical protein
MIIYVHVGNFKFSEIVNPAEIFFSDKDIE